MKQPILLDASCVLAWLFDEPGVEVVEPGLTVVPFSWMHVSEISIIQHASPSKRNLSLGDACCLAYGMSQVRDSAVA